jgi:hypothetical protein
MTLRVGVGKWIGGTYREGVDFVALADTGGCFFVVADG